jgi:hypothetical protein
MQDGIVQHGSSEQADAEGPNKYKLVLRTDLLDLNAPPPTPLSSPNSTWCDVQFEHRTPFFPGPKTPLSAVGRKYLSRTDNSRHGCARLSQTLGVQKVLRKPDRKELSPAALTAKLSDALAAFVESGSTRNPGKSDAALLHESKSTEQLLIPAMASCTLRAAGVTQSSHYSCLLSSAECHVQ